MIITWGQSKLFYRLLSIRYAYARKEWKRGGLINLDLRDRKINEIVGKGKYIDFKFQGYCVWGCRSYRKILSDYRLIENNSPTTLFLK